ncbi:hypothetical protein CXG81DRAFT_28021 [Caulochytrium protostelioides]|uniref:Uncharacterized protein n=1 Tax=Caulochytrium protostelioides TaxID=1555241 RepID=A0A4P9X297_9FUNG|nr:hypothetical protein CXG81DRAFT_28021 [Caulochytrium protostelioides]|eukprot:RKO99198.1 hypothetical protein CXG81DRAFT_28021 [Caulochytrium protostelioides]
MEPAAIAGHGLFDAAASLEAYAIRLSDLADADAADAANDVNDDTSDGAARASGRSGPPSRRVSEALAAVLCMPRSLRTAAGPPLEAACFVRLDPVTVDAYLACRAGTLPALHAARALARQVLGLADDPDRASASPAPVALSEDEMAELLAMVRSCNGGGPDAMVDIDGYVGMDGIDNEDERIVMLHVVDALVDRHVADVARVMQSSAAGRWRATLLRQDAVYWWETRYGYRLATTLGLAPLTLTTPSDDCGRDTSEEDAMAIITHVAKVRHGALSRSNRATGIPDFLGRAIPLS